MKKMLLFVQFVFYVYFLEKEVLQYIHSFV